MQQNPDNRSHVVIRLLSIANGEPHPASGKYVRYYDPSPADTIIPVADLFTTDDINSAKQYPTIQDAIKEYRRIDTRNPIRPDGQPNRPLTAFHVEFIHIETDELGTFETGERLLGGVVSSD